MIYPPHIPLKQRKELCGRLLFFDAAAPLQGKFIKEGAMDVHDSFRQALFSVLSTESHSSRNEEPLDVFLQERINRFDNFLYVFSGDHLALSQTLLTEVTNKAAALSCRNCSKPSTVVCNGGVHDPRLMAQRGFCIAPLREIFNAAYEGVKDYCSYYGTLSLGGQPPRVDFSTQFYPTQKQLNRVLDNYKVDGLTTYDAAQAQVELSLVVNEFDLKSYEAVSFVMFHECVAHALHSIYPSVAGRKGKYSFDPWGEGWMDWVALNVLKDIIEQKGPAAYLSPKIPFQSESLKAAHDLHDAKVNSRRTKPDTPADMNKPYDVRFLYFGAKAAEKTNNLLRQIFNTNQELTDQYQKISPKGEEYRAAFYRLSFDLNMHRDFDNKMRSRFVDHLYYHLPDPNQILTPEQLEIARSKSIIFTSIEKLLENYLSTERVEDLLLAITNLKN